MNLEVTFIAAFVAGALSISSPCILPLIPLYLGHIAGSSVTSGGSVSRSRVMTNATAFVLGFSVIFIALGLALGAAGSLVSTATVVSGNRFWIVRIGGVILMLLGLQQLGILTIPGLGRERRFSFIGNSKGSAGSSFLIGATFGAGWSPCAGPILGAILTLAAGQGEPGQAGALLAVYSMGLAIPFLAVAALGSSGRILKGMTRHMAGITAVSGGIMLAVGAIMVLGIYQQLFVEIAAAVPWTPFEPAI